jgi:hypothetical protein
MNSVYEQAEMEYRRGQLTHEFESAQRLNLLRRIHGRRRRMHVDVVPPYGDARA